MTFKIESWKEKETITVCFEGFLDTTAVINLREECKAAVAQCKKVKLLFRKGTMWGFNEINEVFNWENIIIEAESPLLKYLLNKRDKADLNKF